MSIIQDTAEDCAKNDSNDLRARFLDDRMYRYSGELQLILVRTLKSLPVGVYGLTEVQRAQCVTAVLEVLARTAKRSVAVIEEYQNNKKS